MGRAFPTSGARWKKLEGREREGRRERHAVRVSAAARVQLAWGARVIFTL